MRNTLITLVTLLITVLVFGQSQNQFLSQIGLSETIHSDILKEEREIYIHLPENFVPDGYLTYPVAYILDGELLLPTLVNVHHYYSGGFIPEMILVGVSNKKNRTRDLTPSKIKKKYGFPFREENGKALKFHHFIQDELIPYIEQKYPVTNHRTLIGHSYGGLFTIYSLVHFPEVFDNYIAIDPSIDWDDQKLIKESETSLSTQDYHNKSLFVSMGGQLHMQDPRVTIDNVMEDQSEFTIFARSNLKFAEIVKQNDQNGLTFNWKFYQDDLHGTIAYPSIKDGMISVFRWFQMENTDKFNSPETSNEVLLEIINNRREKLKNHFGYATPAYPEDILSMLGYMSLDMGQQDRSKMFFEQVMAQYPKSASGYDGMADYYLQIGHKEKGIEFLEKAIQFNDSDYYKDKLKKIKK